MMKATLSEFPAASSFRRKPESLLAGHYPASRDPGLRRGDALIAVLRNGCALALALVAVGHTTHASATGFQATGTVVSGSATISQGTISDTIFVDTTEVVIDWQPTDTASSGTINFLPSGNSVLYVDQSASVPLPGYTVLNRILPVDGSGTPVTGRPVAFNGTVTTQLGLNNFPVGNVWFYSPGGIIAGPTAVFDVGGLVLTTNAIDITGGLFGSSGEIRFAGTAGSTSSVELQPGSQVNIVNPGSYLALVAPRVVQGGTVNINGSVAYVGAEAATITINGGLFDIAISAGTDDANGVVHTGATDLTPDQGPQRAFVAAVPKNSALTMLLTGDFGYTAAASAIFQDSAVILSAGHDIAFGQSIDTLNGSTTQPAHISLGNSSFAMTINGRASGAITVNPTGGGTIQFDDFAGFKAGTSLTVGADDGENITAANGLDLHAGQGGTGGNATLYANGALGSLTPGQIAVTGTLTLGSDGFGSDAVAAGGNGQDGNGGTSQMLINGGRVIADSIFISADGFGGNGFDGGNGAGGNARVSVQDGQLAIVTSLNVSADGFGGAEEVDGTSGDGTGGTVLLELLPGSANNAAIVADTLFASASGYGVPIPGDYFASGNGGIGQGGSVRFDLLGGALGVTTDMAMGATGLGGQAAASLSGPLYTAGEGFGGQSTFNLDGGFADVASLSIFTTGEGGFAQPPSGTGLMSTGGNGTAGTSQFIAASGTAIIGDLFVHAYGLGGATDDVFDGDANTAGDGFGGSAEFTFSGVATLDVTALELFANGEGGAGGSGLSSVSTGNAGSGGNGTGGTATMALGPGNLTLAGFAIEANGTGGAGGDNQGTGDAGSGGDGFGGSAILNGTDAEYAFAAVTLEAMGIGGPSGTAISGLPGIVGNGTGGLARLTNADTVAPVLGRSMDSLTLNVGGTGSSIFSGRAEISDTASFTGGGLVITGNLDALGDGPAAAASSGFYYTGSGDGTGVGGDATVAMGGHSEFNLDGSGVFDVAGTLQISGGMNIIVRHTNQSATPTPSIVADVIDFGNFGFISGEAGSLISSFGAMNLVSGIGYIDVNRLDSGGTTLLDAASGTIRVATDLQSAGAVQATGQSVDIGSSGILDFTLATASAGNLDLFASNGLSVTNGAATGAVILGSTLGDVSVTDLGGATVDISTLGSANFSGLTQGQTIQISSADIAIGAGAQLGVIGTTTTLILANARTTHPTFIGGAGSTAGYSLSAAELSRLFSDNIEIRGTFGGAGEPDVVVDSFTMTSRAGTPGGNLGANGSLSISSAGNIDIIGDVALTGLGSGNQLFFTSAGVVGRSTIAVDAGTASISLADGNGAMIGQVNFDAGEVFVATPSAVTDVQAAADTDAITARLALNDGVVRTGVISAGTIFADVSGGLYIQNTGASDAFADRRGFAALTDTLDIVTRSPAARIVVNGTLVDTVAGTTLTGLDVMPLVRINGVVGATRGNFDPRSTVNGCLIGSPTLCTVNMEELPNLPPPHESITEPLDPGDGSSSGLDLFPTMIVQLKDFAPFGYPPLIDEPVTGAGNDDLWMPPCENDQDSGCIAP